jgi:glycyl-tRNA synthetase
LRFREHEADELSFYSAGTFDVEYNYPRWWGELQGIANRTDYDLTQHQNTSKQDLQYNDPKTWARYIPFVIEPSFGLSRTVMAVMMDCYDEEIVKEWDTRVVVRFPFDLAPVKFAVLPLIEKSEEMVALWRKINQDLKTSGYTTDLDLWGNIGKRYRRQDEIGTPYCICVDHQSLEDGTVTVRDRDTMTQTVERIKREDIKNKNFNFA